MDVIREREERVAGASNPIQLASPRLLFLFTQRLHRPFEQTFPVRPLATFQHLPAHEQIDRVGFLCTLHSLFERQSKHTRMVSEPPEIRFAPGKPRTMNTGLLACPEANDGSSKGIRYTVGLSVLECQGGDDQIRERRCWKLIS